jgi:type I restriction enzyme, S subunit
MSIEEKLRLDEGAGLISKRWETVNFGMVREWLQYGTSTRCSPQPSAFPVLRIPNIEPARINANDLKYAILNRSEAEQYRLKKGDLLFVRTNGGLERLGNCAVYDENPENALFASYIIRARLRLDLVDPYFVAYFFSSHLGSSIIAGRATPAADGKYNLNTGTIDSLPIALPATLEEQRAIAGALTRIREAIRLQDQSTDLSRRFKRAAMIRLFTFGLRGRKDSEAESGSVPEGWMRLPISSLGQIITGTTPPTNDQANYVAGDIPFIAPGDIEHGCSITRTEKLITRRGLNVSRPIKAGTTCFVCIGSTIGKVGYATATTCATNQQINSIVPNDQFDARFVFHLMTYWAEHVRKQASPSPVPILSKGAFEQIEILATTDKEEQKEIAGILDVIDQKIDLHRCKRSRFDDLFRVLLHKLMTGEIRVADLELSALDAKPLAELAA